jgi:SpoVK/Ycf46/Vps4 family AAA+-type ATPase
MSIPIENDPAPLVADFRKAMQDLEELYRTAGLEVARSHPELTEDAPREFVNRMLDLHRGLLIKVYAGLYPLDWRNTPAEYQVAQELFRHVWDKSLEGEPLQAALEKISADEGTLRWDALVGPFERLRPLRNRVGQLQTLVLRFANIVAKASGRVHPKEVRHLQWIQAELRRHLERLPLESPGGGEVARVANRYAVQTVMAEAQDIRADWQMEQVPEADVAAKSPEERLAEAMDELHGLIGLDAIKQQVQSLVNFLKVQAERDKFGLPRTPIALHAIFQGNPGTGKTTVARLVGRILGALGILSKGHLIETDRSGLVAEYAGQTGPKTNRRIDEAQGGVLFIDEAYSLVAEKGDDPYGAEAVQTLLKRMEDDRDRFVVILAGYPRPMERLLHTNPGLTSRFSRSFEFPDYTAAELGRIFEGMCEKSEYALPALTRVKLLLGFQYLLNRRDEHFGNGRLVRNVFERAIGQLADRIAQVVPLTRELLTTLEHTDILLEGVPGACLEPLDSDSRRIRIGCPGCEQVILLAQKHLGKMLQCKKCQESFFADWGEIVEDRS